MSSIGESWFCYEFDWCSTLEANDDYQMAWAKSTRAQSMSSILPLKKMARAEYDMVFANK